jgi:hypothetical protein
VGGGFVGGGISGQYSSESGGGFVRNDVRLDFDWGTRSPGGSVSPNYVAVGADRFSVKWEGMLLPRFNERYSFHVTTDADDQFKMFVREIDLRNPPADFLSWTWSPADSQALAFAPAGSNVSLRDWSADFGPMSNDPAKTYQVQIRYRENLGAAAFKLRWSSPSTPPEVVEPVAALGFNLRQTASWEENFFTADAVASARWWFGSAAQPWQANLYDSGTALPVPVDAAGWPQTDFSLYLAENVKEVEGLYTASFAGRAKVNVYAGGLPVKIAGGSGRVHWDGVASSPTKEAADGYDPATDRTTFQVWLDPAVCTGKRATILLTFTETRRAAGAPANSGVTGLSVMRPNDWDRSYSFRAGTLFTDHFKDALRRFTTIRTMEAGATNGNQSKTWADRTLPGYWNWQGRGVADLANARLHPAGLSWEHQIMLANETGKDLYICVPQQADDDYMRKLARLIRFGSDGVTPYASAQANPIYPPLNSNLKVVVEYSNEVWNFAPEYSQSRENFDAAARAVAAFRADPLGLTPESRLGRALAFDGSTDPWQHARRHHAYRTAAMSNAFRSVFGDAAMGDRVRPVLMWQYANENDTARDGLAFLGRLWQADPAAFGAEARPANYYVWGGGGATYYKGANEFGVDAALPGQNFEAGPGPNWAFVGDAGVRDVPGGRAAYVTGAGRLRVTFTLPADQVSDVYAVRFKTRTPEGSAALEAYLDGPSEAAGGTRLSNPGWTKGDAEAMPVYTWAKTYSSLTFRGAPGSRHTIDLVGLTPGRTVLIDDFEFLSVDAFLDAETPAPYPHGDAGYGPTFEAYQRRTRVEAEWAKSHGLQFVAYEGGWAFGGDAGGTYGAYPLLDYLKFDITPADARYEDLKRIQARALDAFARAGVLNVLGTYAQFRTHGHASGRPGSWQPLPAASDEFNGRLTRLAPDGGAASATTFAAPVTLTPAMESLSSNAYMQSNAPAGYPPLTLFKAARTPTVSDWASWNVYAPESGFYRVTAVATGTGRLALSIDGLPLTPPAGAPASPSVTVVAYLTQGLHTVRVDATAGTFTLARVEVVKATPSRAPGDAGGTQPASVAPSGGPGAAGDGEEIGGWLGALDGPGELEPEWLLA